MAENDSVFSFGADTSNIENAIDKIGGQLTGLGKTATTAIGAFFAFDAATSLFKSATSAAIESEKAVRQFNFALQAAGVFTKEASEGFQKYAESLQAITGVSDEAILEGATNLIQIGELSGETLNRTIVSALDLAAARGIDAAQAFDMLARAAQGNVMPFQKMGVEFAKNASDAEKLNTVLGFIEGKFSGAAQQSLLGYEGAVKNLSNTWNDLLENFGKTATQSSFVVSIINGMSDALKFFQFFINMTIGGVKDLIAAFQFFGAALPGIIQGIGLLDFGRVAREIDNAKTKLWEHMAATQEWLASTVTATAQATPQLIAPFKGQSEAIEETKISLQELRAAQSQYEEEMLSAAPATQQFAAGFMKSMREMSASVVQLGKTVGGIMVTGFSGAFAAMGKALVQGEDAFGAFGKAILGMLGNIAIQMGQFYIAAGIAALWLNPAQGAGMIAGGAALSILGGVLQALAGDSGTAAAGGGAGARGAVGASTPLSMTDSQSFMNEFADEQQRQQAQTGITINVQGNILDRRETGLALAEIINDSFNNNGVLITANA